MTTSRNNEASITGGPGIISLGDLRWLVEQLKDGNDDHIVRVKVDNTGHQLDPGSTTLSSQVPDRVLRGRPIKDSPQA
jgi:hypothetical protein